MKSPRIYLFALSTLGVAGLVAGCTSEKIVYRSGTQFAAPPASAQEFIGYYDEDNKLTVCGSCHVEKQAAWAQTKHSHAWEDLQASGHATGTCDACHSVNDRGNFVADTAVGYNSTKAARYHDVQCEACHGPGLTHASAPNSVNRPLASIKADTAATNGCGECHQGTHTPFIEEWRASGHSQTWATSHNSTDPYCQGCHTAQGALVRWGVNDNYIEKDSTSNPQSAVCIVCHNPHGSPNDHQLRFPLNAATIDGNLCTQCHQRRGTLTDILDPTNTRNSVHSPEGPTLFGLAGWFPPGMAASDSIIATHGNPERNPKLCATCHVSAYAGTDAATGASVFSTGHRFLPNPCVDASGLPTEDQTCADSARTYRSCVSGGCHASENTARNAQVTAEARITLLAGQANALIAKVKAGAKASECTFVAGKPYTTCLGTQFNVSVATKNGAAVHNPFLTEQLLIASINQMMTEYGVALTRTVDLTPMFKKGQMIYGSK